MIVHKKLNFYCKPVYLQGSAKSVLRNGSVYQYFSKKEESWGG